MTLTGMLAQKPLTTSYLQNEPTTELTWIILSFLTSTSPATVGSHSACVRVSQITHGDFPEYGAALMPVEKPYSATVTIVVHINLFSDI